MNYNITVFFLLNKI